MNKTDMKAEDNASWLMMMDAEIDKWNGHGSVVEQVKEAIEDCCCNGGLRFDLLNTSVY